VIYAIRAGKAVIVVAMISGLYLLITILLSLIIYRGAAPKHRLRKTPLHQSERAMAARAGRPGES